MLDDFSRYILSWRLSTTMGATDIEETLQMALDKSNITQVKVKHRPRLLSDNGPFFVSQTLERAHGGHWLPQELQARIRNLKEAINQLVRQREFLLEAYLAEVLQLPEFERKQQELKQKQAALEQLVEQLNATAEQPAAPMDLFPPIETFCQRVQPILEQATFAQRRQLVELLVDRSL